MALRLTSKDKEKIKRVNNSVRRKNKQMDNYNIDIYLPVISATKFTSRKQLNEYFSIDTGEGYPKNDNTKRRYNVIGPMIRKRLAQIDSKNK